MSSFLTPLYESNDCHEPAGSPTGGQFCGKGEWTRRGRTEPRTDAERGLKVHLTAVVELKQQMGSPKDLTYLGLDDFVLKHGRFYDSQPLTTAEQQYFKSVLEAYGRKCPIQQCFYNSQMVLLTAERLMATRPDMQLRYVEGYTASVIPIHHGWLTLNGKVIDPTLRNDAQPTKSLLSKRTVGTFPETMAYYGVPFRTEEVLQSMMQRSEGGSLLIDYKRKFPFLRKPYTVEEASP